MINPPIEYFSLERLVNAVTVEKFPTWDHYMSNVRDLERALDELNYLRFFYEKVYEPLGPANDDIYEIIQTNFINDGGHLPEKYEQR